MDVARILQFINSRKKTIEISAKASIVSTETGKKINFHTIIFFFHCTRFWSSVLELQVTGGNFNTWQDFNDAPGVIAIIKPAKRWFF